MTTKRILVLANSTKHHPRSCVAGRELFDTGDGNTRWGGWIRPVSNHDEGALDFVERRLTGAGDPKPLDVIQVPLLANENNQLQPENWLVLAGQAWTKASSLQPELLLPLVESPDNLWLQSGQKYDRVSSDSLRQSAIFQSLYLIRPQSFEFNMRSKTWDGKTTKQLRGHFNYKGQFYDLKLTDPLITRKYFPDFNRATEGYSTPGNPSKILLCISLTPPFEADGLHYKVIATIIELP
jgi:hypothetical protein